MIIVVIIFSLIYVILLTIILVAYYRDNTEIDRRILELEKRIEEFKREVKEDYKGIYIPINDDMSLLIPLCEKDKFDMDRVNYYFSNYGNPNLEIEKITPEKEDDRMACGRKGRPRGSKNIGGRRK